jgi:ElaB/YqjD/DUF883 family membrane-anchored ribosome-binding protein
MQQQPPSQGGGGAADELRSDAKHLGNSAANRIHSEVDSRKDGAVEQAKSVSSTVQRVAGELPQDSPEWLKFALRQSADKIQSFADTIERKDSRELMRDAQDFARNNPGTFLAACAAAGFAAARILKAGGEQQNGFQGNEPSQLGAIGTPQSDWQQQQQPQQPSAGARTRGEFV